VIIASDLHFGHPPRATLDALTGACLEDPQRLLILAGDLTEHGNQQQYEGVAALLRGMVERGVRVVCCPGNHDLSYFWGYAPSPRGKRRGRYRDHITSLMVDQPENLDFTNFDTVMRLGDDVVISLRSVHRRGRLLLGNRVKEGQIRWAREVLDRHDIIGHTHRIHLVTHHSLWRVLGQDKHANLHRRKRLERLLLVPYSAASFINGHNHYFSAAERETPKSGHRLYHIQAPSLSKGSSRGARGFVRWVPGSSVEASLVEV